MQARVLVMAMLCATSVCALEGRKLLQYSASATAVAKALGSGDANAAAKAIASSTNGTAVASALAQAITSGQGTAAANAVAQAASQGAGTNAAQALAQALVQTANQTAGIPAATQALNDVGDAGVQSVEDDTCSTLAKLATDALYRGDFDTAAHILATVFIQGGECGKAVFDGIQNNIPQLGCGPLLKAASTAYQLAQAAGQGDAFEAGFASQPAFVAAVNACLQPQDAGSRNGTPTSGTASAQGILDSLVAPASAFAQATASTTSPSSAASASSMASSMTTTSGAGSASASGQSIAGNGDSSAVAKSDAKTGSQ